MKWIFFSYSLPADPSRARVYIWRQLKKLGAVNHQSVWVVPHSKDRVEALKSLTEEIEKYKGTALLLGGNVLVESQNEEIVEAFIGSRNEEYREVIEQCEAFLKEIEYEVERHNFSFAEVEENEEELEKLKQWLRKVERRDPLKAPLRKEAHERIKQSKRVFEDFARRVYEHQKSCEALPLGGEDGGNLTGDTAPGAG